MSRPLEVWGGLECTLNRVGDRYINQSVKSGHIDRISDLSLFADLGIKKIRYPGLWELVAPEHPDHSDWSWLDERFGELKRLGISPIAGFLHHGSGPRYTSLIDPDFPEKLARYARAFAERFPWIEDYTPINEINTTARFSCLYGHWYPHHKSDHSYLTALLLQCKATVLAMEEVRKINPRARLIQTDDLGRTQASAKMQYQADFENHRRWLSWDILNGNLNEDHALYTYFINAGVDRSLLNWTQKNICPPDIIGINHYHLSNRFLDERVDLYPEWARGFNGMDYYADVGAVDTGRAEMPTPESLMLETWERYRIPIAVTEVHTRGNREAQMRWIYEIWNSAKSSREKGAEITAITIWSLLGTFDWHNLCTKCEMFYEPGVFDLRTSNGVPKKTALTHIIKDLTSKGFSDNPILEDAGPWATSRRILFAAQVGSFTSLHKTSRPILITGATGTLGQAFARICGARNINYRLLKRSDLDIADINKVRAVVAQINPWAIINTAGYVNVEAAEVERDKCFRENVAGPVNLARVSAERNISYVTFSSDLVFNGENDFSYIESHLKNPLNVYGQSKAECEEQVLKVNPNTLVIRTSSFFGPWDDYNFVTITLRNLAKKQEMHALHDVKISPTYVPDLAETTLDLILDGETGIIHLTNKGSFSWAELAKIAVQSTAGKLNLDHSLIIERSIQDMNFKARRPKNSTLSSERLSILPSFEDALGRYLDKVQI